MEISKTFMVSIFLIAVLLVTACDTRTYNATTTVPSVNDKPSYNNNEQIPETILEENATPVLPLPVMDMTNDDKYFDVEGGLYGKGMNIPPEAFRQAAIKAGTQVTPLDSNGNPSDEGKIGFIAIGMDTTKLEFGAFRAAVIGDPEMNPSIVFVNGAQDGKDLYLWSTTSSPWSLMGDSVAAAGLTKKQVQVAWIMLADSNPTGEFPRSARDYQGYMKSIVLRVKTEYPNVKIVYLSSGIYGGYDTTNFDPEPYAYESAFGIRWLINDQINGNSELNYDQSNGVIRAPVMVWGPYLWANGENPRSDGLTWDAEDFSEDGHTPSKSGLSKTTKLLVDYFKFNDLASNWFVVPMAE